MVASKGVARALFITALAVTVLLAGTFFCALPHADAAVKKPAKVKISSVSSMEPGQITVKLKKAKRAKGYQYLASTSRKFDKGTRYDLESLSSAKTTVTLSSLKENVSYYVKARAYAKKGKKKIWGAWSAAKTVKTKAAINPLTRELEKAKEDLEKAYAEVRDLKEDLEKTYAEIRDLKEENAELRSSHGESTEKTATLVYNLYGGSLPADAKREIASWDGEYALPAPTRDGYDFLGWYTGKDGGIRVETVNCNSGNVELHAHWMPIENFDNVERSWTLKPGYYTAGIDIPAGVFDVTALAGEGYVLSEEGSANMAGPEHEGDSGNRTTSFKNYRLGKGQLFEVRSLHIQLDYSQVLSNVTGRSYDTSSSVELGPGNYCVGRDINPGLYNVQYVSGDGGFVMSDRVEGESRLSCNMDGDPETGDYTDLCSNALLVDGETFRITSGLTLLFIPEEN